jgi:hypothetical protein
MIDMANHNGGAGGSTANMATVAFEYFGNAYSLAVSATATAADNDAELFISYGDRSNDQLLQYYGFCEPNNPHDVYVLPPIREWDLAALEKSCGRTVPAGRLADLALALEALERAAAADDTGKDDLVGGGGYVGGIVVTRRAGIDPSAVQLIRALFATEAEWDAAGRSVGKFQDVVSVDNETCSKKVVAAVLAMELERKATTLEQDERLMSSSSSKGGNTALSSLQSPAERLAVRFRIEKKKLLREAIAALQQ